jgi:hypothetical protein
MKEKKWGRKRVRTCLQAAADLLAGLWCHGLMAVHVGPGARRARVSVTAVDRRG